MDRLEIIKEWASVDTTCGQVVQEQILLVAEAAGVTPERVAIAINAPHDPAGRHRARRTKWWCWGSP